MIIIIVVCAQRSCNVFDFRQMSLMLLPFPFPIRRRYVLRLHTHQM